MKQTLHFSVDSALLRELGEKLVETVHLALSELVKNAYDADATEVEVVFETSESGVERIKIIDNGIGMNFDSVQNYWMRIATTNKEKQDVSPVYGRHLTGAKGIGRFSCRRLGSQLTLITQGTKEGGKRGFQKSIQRTQVDFPWTKFEVGTDVTEIECHGEQIEIDEEYTGTTLIIDNASSEWSARGLNWLTRQLAVLAANRGDSKVGFEPDPGFEIMITAPDFKGGIKDIREDLINAGWGTLTAKLNEKHQAVCELQAMGIGKRTITSKQTFPALKDIQLQVGLMVDDREQMRDTTVLSKENLRAILSKWGGVQIRHRGFRVFPYGNDDWLKIDRDRGLRKGAPDDELQAFASSLQGVDPTRVLLTALSMHNYVGNVSIGAKSSGFEMKASREGFIESPAMNELREFVRYAIDWANILRDYFLRQEKLKVADIAKEQFEKLIEQKVDSRKIVDSALDFINSEIKSKVYEHLPSAVKNEVTASLNIASEAIRTYNDSVKVELSHLRLIASTSTLLLIFSHEVKSLLGLLEQSKNSLKLIAKMLPKTEEGTVNEIGQDFEELNTRLGELLQMTSLISSSAKSKLKPGNVALKPKIRKVEKVFELVTQKYGINIDYEDIPNNMVVNDILEAELYSVLLNVMSNSIKAVIAGGRQKNIKISAKRAAGMNEIIIQDSGVGLEEDRFSEVFIPFVSDPDGTLYENLEARLNPEDNMIVGTGSGLGLGIVNEIVKAKGGTVAFQYPDDGWATQLQIKLP
ncbi:MAG TPA: sensor histidine kinase [Haliscomenobacter sp.]|uniref:ATP-binding protein n=1 Tax=Haliscomenobacter sp. TaxID=2717303 RepID=UPI002CA86764|nr:sensor histidine kinase [Haliscomenobacter sp.]HOY17405.1 sensor histidine kinase [Haliscomenobacter sp.]